MDPEIQFKSVAEEFSSLEINGRHSGDSGRFGQALRAKRVARVNSTQDSTEGGEDSGPTFLSRLLPRVQFSVQEFFGAIASISRGRTTYQPQCMYAAFSRPPLPPPPTHPPQHTQSKQHKTVKTRVLSSFSSKTGSWFPAFSSVCRNSSGQEVSWTAYQLQCMNTAFSTPPPLPQHPHPPSKQHETVKEEKKKTPVLPFLQDWLLPRVQFNVQEFWGRSPSSHRGQPTKHSVCTPLSLSPPPPPPVNSTQDSKGEEEEDSGPSFLTSRLLPFAFSVQECFGRSPASIEDSLPTTVYTTPLSLSPPPPLQ